MAINPLQAINPQTSATVSASAGTGKTWLLVSRLLRLLLNDTEPQSILAITFTRKAAAEMQSRLNERLFQLATCTNLELDELLQAIDAPDNATTRNKARNLYEQLLQNPQSITITTFHAFCQDLLRRFPFEADVPPGFELAEQTAELETEAWDALVNDTTRNPNSHTAAALEILFDYCNGLPNTQTTLRNFLHHRSDWWAYTYQQQDPVAFASTQLSQQMGIESIKDDPLQQFFTNEHMTMLDTFLQLLQKHPTKTNLNFVEKLETANKAIALKQYTEAFYFISTVFLTDKNQPRARKPSNSQKSKMGEAGEVEFLEIHDSCCKAILKTRDTLARINTFNISCAWYKVGNQLLENYQLIKKEKRALDFTDLEWNAFRLLHEGNNALWVQYKLDARINHILIDEFQDTNPTQWQLLYPLLNELAASPSEPDKSVFLVGDVKQSIYRFRRAEPKLFDAAQQWMQDNLDAKTTHLDTSRRSAPAIMDFINQCFSEGKLYESIQHFNSHKTVHDSQWGYVECVPLFANDTDDTDNENMNKGELRNPLLTPRSYAEDQRYQREGSFIADKIKKMVESRLPVTINEETRAVRYSDIVILLRHRTHAHVYQNALMQSGIPYVGTERGTLLEALEIRDIVCLLETLVAPYNNLSMATVLRSPIFAFEDEDLMQLALIKDGYWYQRLHRLAERDNRKSIVRARDLLAQWRKLVETIPVHDLLDRIYSDCNLIERYQAAFPQHSRQQVKSNLLRFIELALEIDSGRYPSIGRFLFRIKSMKASDQDAPDETSAGSDEDRVRLLTIHAAKGLEAPVIFLADSANTQSTRMAYQPLINWPAEHNSPKYFLLSPKKIDMDSWAQQHLDRHLAEQEREETNLLYVALTRARQVLYVSGCEPRKNAQAGEPRNWYGLIMSRLKSTNDNDSDHQVEPFIIESGTKSILALSQQTVETHHSMDVDPRLRKPILISDTGKEILPSQQGATQLTDRRHIQNSNRPADSVDEDLQIRGVIIHKMLQLIAEGKSQQDIYQRISQMQADTIDYSILDEYYREAKNVITYPNFQFLFNEQHYDNAYNEVPIQFNINNRRVYGIIDRVVISGNTIHIVDYKTHQDIDTDNQQLLLERYQPQLSLYAKGIEKIWPGHQVQPALLFTHNLILSAVTCH